MTPEEFQHHTQQAVAAGWDCLRALSPDKPHDATTLFDAIAAAEAQLAGLRLTLLDEARYADSAVALDTVHSSTRANQAYTPAAPPLPTPTSKTHPQRRGTPLPRTRASLAGDSARPRLSAS